MLACVTHGVLHAADGIADLAFHFVHFALGLQLLIARGLAGSFLHCAFALLGHSLDPFLVHRSAPRFLWRPPKNGLALGRFPEDLLCLTGGRGPPIALASPART